MQSIASKSPFGWTLVKRIEDDPDYNKADLGIDGKGVRAYEKELVSYNKDLAAANRCSTGKSHPKFDRDCLKSRCKTCITYLQTYKRSLDGQ